MKEYFEQFGDLTYELGIPARLKRDAKGVEDFEKFRNKFEGYNLYSTVYGFQRQGDYSTAVIDKFFFEFDSQEGLTEDLLNDVRKVVKWIKENTDYAPLYFFSGRRGFHFVIHFEPITLRNTNECLQRFRDTILRFTLSRYLDDGCHPSTAAMRRVPNTKHAKTGLYAIPVHEDELLTLSPSELKKMAQKRRESWFEPTLSKDAPKVLHEIDKQIEEERLLDRLLPPVKLEMKTNCMAHKEATEGVDYGYRDFALVGMIMALKQQGTYKQVAIDYLINEWLPKNDPKRGDEEWVKYKVNYHWDKPYVNPCKWFYNAKIPLCEDCPTRLKMERVKN